MTLPNGGRPLERALERAAENVKRNTWSNEHDAAIERGELAHPDDGGGLEDDATFWAASGPRAPARD